MYRQYKTLSFWSARADGFWPLYMHQDSQGMQLFLQLYCKKMTNCDQNDLNNQLIVGLNDQLIVVDN